MIKQIAVISVLTLLLVATTFAQRPKPEETTVRGKTMYTLLKPGEIPAIFEPEFVPISETEKMFYPEEPIMVVRAGNEVKGYSTWHLDHHEVVNDYIGGKAITVTW